MALGIEAPAVHGIGEGENSMQLSSLLFQLDLVQIINSSGTLLAQGFANSSDSDVKTIGEISYQLLTRHLLAATIFSLLGILVLSICIYLFDRIVPFSFRKEILEDQNTALGIIVAAVLLGMSIIIAAAIQG